MTEPAEGGPPAVAGPPAFAAPSHVPAAPPGPPAVVAPAPPMGPQALLAPAAPRRFNVWVPVLAGLSAFFLLATLATGGLLVVRSSDLSSSEETVASQQDELIEKNRKLATVEGERDKVKSDLDGSKTELGAVNADKAVIAACLKAVFAFFDAAGTGNKSLASAAIKKLDTACAPAEALIGALPGTTTT